MGDAAFRPDIRPAGIPRVDFPQCGYDPSTVGTVSLPAGKQSAGPPLRSKRFLALAWDERLVQQVRRGNEAAFEVIYERHLRGVLAFCRHMLGSHEEAE